MSDESDSLLFLKRTEPDDFKDHTAEIIWHMRNGYRRRHGIVEQPPEMKEEKYEICRNENYQVRPALHD